MCECIDATGFVTITHALYVPVSCANPPATSCLGLVLNSSWFDCSGMMGTQIRRFGPADILRELFGFCPLVVVFSKCWLDLSVFHTMQISPCEEKKSLKQNKKSYHHFAGGWGSPAPLKVSLPLLKLLHVFFCCVKMNEHFLVVLSSKAFILTPCRYLSFLFQIQQRAKSTRR